MNRIGTAITIFLALMTLAVITTTITYFMVYGVISFIVSSFELPDKFFWVPFAGTCAVFLVGLVTTVRNRIPDLTGLKWDSGTIQDCPSPIRIYRTGGRMWNINPLGPQSVTSIGAIGGAFLCAGPSLAISAFIIAIEELRKNDQLR